MESLFEDFVKQYEKLGMKATGRWKKELDYEVLLPAGKLIGKVTGAHYTHYLVKGRKPGKMPPTKAIKLWIIARGIKSKDRRKSANEIADAVRQIREKGRKPGKMPYSLAYAIARQIGEKGTKYFQQGGTNLISAVLTPQRIDLILKDVGDAVLLEQAEKEAKFLEALFVRR